MTDFAQTQWANRRFSRTYLENADYYIPDRFHLFHVLRSFYRHFVAKERPARICDLGCGDGVLADQLLREDAAIEATLVDASAEMLAAARARLKPGGNVRYLEKDFEALIRDSSEWGVFDLVVSSFAIHHLIRVARQRLFAAVFQHLEPHGWFMNIEATLPDHSLFNEWYYALWQGWIDHRGQLLCHGGKFQHVPREARENPDNKYSPLAEQLSDLESAGFKNVECHYKNGIFAIYTGQKVAG